HDTTATTGPGYARVYSGRTGLPLFTVSGTEPGHALGGSACNLGDVDGDGRADLAIGSFWTSKLACALLVSGADGSLLRKLEMPSPSDGGEVAVMRLADRDVDGIDDCGLSYRDRVIAVSSKDGRQLFACGGSPFRPHWVGDFDRDGIREIVGCETASRPTLIDEDNGIEATLWSGRTGTQLAKTFFTPFGMICDITSMGDVDGDGQADLLMVHDDVIVLSGARFFPRMK
ncbi:MAG TPA: hypothetical protein VK843_20855, partial [Planctomycetota bacterium]|nr:hypothetical protein [Planctomycetota bacterium]